MTYLKSTSVAPLASWDSASLSLLATILCSEMICRCTCSSETLPDMSDSTLFHWKGPEEEEGEVPPLSEGESLGESKKGVLAREGGRRKPPPPSGDRVAAEGGT